MPKQKKDPQAIIDQFFRNYVSTKQKLSKKDRAILWAVLSLDKTEWAGGYPPAYEVWKGRVFIADADENSEVRISVYAVKDLIEALPIAAMRVSRGTYDHLKEAFYEMVKEATDV